MLRKNICVIIIFFTGMLPFSVSNAQHAVGLSGGYATGTFINFTKKQNYDATYHWKNGGVFSVFYQFQIDSTSIFGVEMQYKFQKADIEINNNAGNSSFYKNMDYSFQMLNFNLNYSFRLIEKKSLKMYLLFGMIFSYNTKTAAQGNGWEFYMQRQTDTNGNPVNLLTTRHWEKEEHYSKDLSLFNMGIETGLDFLIPVNNSLDFILQNRYNIFATNISTANIRYTSLFTGYLNIGLRYNFRKRH
jgi:hypothetical protein